MWEWLIRTAHAATSPEPSVTVSLSMIDHIAGAIVALFTALGVCGGFVAWVIRSRADNKKTIMDEMKALVATEKSEREEDISDAGDAFASLNARMDKIDSELDSCAKQTDMANLYRLIEKLGDDASRGHQALRDSFTAQLAEVTRQVGVVDARVFQLFERRAAPRD